MLLGLLSARAGTLAASPLELLAERWPWRIFDREEGLIPGPVSVTYQDVDDFIYASTERGLCRYDLHHWHVIENTEPFDGGEIVRIVESLNLIYCASARVLWTIQGGTSLRRVYPERGGVSGRIFVAATKQGEVFLIDEARKIHHRISNRQVEVTESGVLLPEGTILDYQIDQEDVHWLATNLGLYRRTMAQRYWTEVSELDLPGGDSSCRRFLSFQTPSATPLPRGRRLSRQRELWGVFESREGGGDWFLARLEGGLWRRFPGEIIGPPVETVTSDREGNYYATCEDGRLFFREAGGESWRRVERLGLGLVKLHGGLLDSRGNLWFRLGAGGVAFVNIRSRRWQTIRGLSGPPYPNVLSLLETDEGELWVGTERGCLRYPRGAAGSGGEPFVYERISDTEFKKITALGEDRRGRVWVGSESFDGVYSFDPESATWERTAFSHSIHRIVRDFLGELWLLSGETVRGAQGAKLYRVSLFTGYELQAVPIESSLPREFRTDDVVVNGLVRTQGDVFWLATEVGLLECQLEGGRLVVSRRLTERDGLLSSRIWDVEEGPDGDIWVCYPSSGRGVTRIYRDAQRESLQYFDVGDGLAHPEVWTIVRSGQDLWLGTGGGISRYDGQTWYSMPTASAGPYSSLVFCLVVSRHRESQGSLFVGTEEHGVVKYESDDSRRPRFAFTDFPSVTDKNGTITLRWRARDFKNQTTPEDLIYRFRVDGGTWQYSRGIDSVTLEQLGLGEHTFELEVRDLDGNRNREIVLHSFEVPTGAFSWPLLAIVAGLGGGLALILVLRWTVWRSRVRNRHARYRAFYAGYPAAVLLVEPGGRIVDYNGKSPELLGLEGVDATEVRGRPLEMVPVLAALRAGPFVESAFGGERFQLRGRTAAAEDGQEKCVHILGFPLPGTRHRVSAVVVVVEDRTRETEEQGLEARERRLRGLRDFAGRLVPNLEGLLDEVKESGTARDDVDGPGAASEKVRRAEDVVRELQAFSRPAGTRSAASRVELELVLESLLDVRGNGTEGSLELGRRVELDYRAQTGLWPVQVESEALREAIEAVLSNAADAMPERGKLTVRLVNRRVDEDPGRLVEGSYVELTIADSGPGMDPEQLETIFDPFYSTKPRDRAEGLGLSRAFGLIRSQGGDIRVQSRPGVGTRVQILLPADR